MIPKTTLEQWAVLRAIVEKGSYALAADALHRSQSSICYMVNRLQDQLGVELLVVEGRRAKLTSVGEALLAKATELLCDAEGLERLARQLAKGWEPEIRLAVDSAFPTVRLVQALRTFSTLVPESRVILKDVVLSGADEALLNHDCDIAIGSKVPLGYLGDYLCSVDFIAVAEPNHALHKLNRNVVVDDLLKEQHIVVRDSGTLNPRDDGWFTSTRRLSVTSLERSTSLVLAGIGFAWLPDHLVHDHIQHGRLKALPIAKGQVRKVDLYLIHAEQDFVGPATRQLAKVLAAA